MNLALRSGIVAVTILILSSFSINAATIKGFVYDKNTREQLVGAIVSLSGTKYGTATELDGRFTIHNVLAGTYKLKVEFVSYESQEMDITITENQELTVKIDLSLKSSVLKEVQITGKYARGSEEEAQNREKNGHEIMNVMSARAMLLSPDVTVAGVLQRVSGVSLVNTNSGKQYSIIRGMDRKYNSTLVNGVKIPSPNDRDRYVPVNIFPVQLLERLEVIKTLSPSMEGDASGGVVNIVMKNAPDHFLADAEAGIGYCDIFQHQNFLKFSNSTVEWRAPSERFGTTYYAKPTDFPYQNLLTTVIHTPINSQYGLSLGNRFFKDKLGVIVSGSYQSTYTGYTSLAYLESPTLAATKTKYDPLSQTFSDLNYRELSTLSNRLGTMAKIDYEINSRNNISLFATYVEMDDYRSRYTIDSGLGGHSNSLGYVEYNSLHHRIETRTTLQNIANITLQGKHKFIDNLSGDWSLVASKAEQQIPDDAQISYGQGVNIDGSGNVSYTSPYVTSENRYWNRNTDKDLAGYANLHYSPGFIRGLSLIDIGGLYRHKTRDNFANEYTNLSPVDDPGQTTETYTSIPNAKFVFIPSNGALGLTNDPGIYTFTEDILAYYLQANYDINNKLNFFGGLRVENTNSGYVCDLPVTVAGKSANYIYTDFLPSLQAKYAITNLSNLRASYFRSIYRPAYGDYIPNPVKTEYEDYDFIGNPYLNHTVIDNFDLRYEIFPKGLDQLMVGVFNKNLQDPIEYQITQKTKTEEHITPLNTGSAQNYGFEIVFRKYFGKLGVSGNYTYTKSQITSSKQLLYLDSANRPFPDTQQVSRPLVGQSANIGNISLLYKDSKHKIDAQVAFVYTGERINLLSPYKGLDLWQKPTLSLDFSAEKGIGKHFTVYVKANNILNSGFELFIKQHNQAYSGDAKLRFQESPNYVTVQKDYFKASFLFGVKFKL